MGGSSSVQNTPTGSGNDFHTRHTQFWEVCVFDPFHVFYILYYVILYICIFDAQLTHKWYTCCNHLLQIVPWTCERAAKRRADNVSCSDILEWGGRLASPRDENFLREGGGRLEILSSVEDGRIEKHGNAIPFTNTINSMRKIDGNKNFSDRKIIKNFQSTKLPKWFNPFSHS